MRKWRTKPHLLMNARRVANAFCEGHDNDTTLEAFNDAITIVLKEAVRYGYYAAREEYEGELRAAGRALDTMQARLIEAKSYAVNLLQKKQKKAKAKLKAKVKPKA